MNCVLAKQSFPNQTSKLFLYNLETNLRRNYKIARPSSSNVGVHNRCRGPESVVPLKQSLFCLYSEKKNFTSSRNFSISSTLQSWMDSNQDKEKRNNYIFFGVIIVSVIFVTYMLQTMQYHQDYVQIEPSENKK